MNKMKKAMLAFLVCRIDAISGATHSYQTFVLLAKAVLEQAEKGIKQIAFVENTAEQSGAP